MVSFHRRCQVALESDRRRLLRRCLSAWRILFQAERSQQDLLNQQEETQRKMAALINAATSGKLGLSNTVPPAPSPTLHTTIIPPEMTPTQTQPPPPAVPDVALPLPEALPMQVWQGMKCQMAINIDNPYQRLDGAPQKFGKKEERHKEQQRTIAEQRQHLRDQSQQIRLLLEEQRMLKYQWKEQRMVGEKWQAQIAPPLCPDPEGLTLPVGLRYPSPM
ncbi:hypothetical protein SKAU_G00060300 [Synaphobranchus kaupii]|uniref:Uncharacterized protein n=1 Tax=Synaphobranchus kaupii TaxID=118154 RepID=A0A9Q1JAP3_SYNKA|nr:hypothetical protein SKAU_G00060300 [Synaphobranchus kaupii]